ncbi:Stress-antifung domain-containing protein/Pkinase_Tyr domain-containing protein [Cephalotus follicularis]|uniref:Stress-antifung domain-containing protein/Pkinase_Tyr domain-containing protein n=1 Tax=Cephalotus follicularis TaxID=3775 RepID=A0A1Q3B3Z2_CEPFO|nr:Stress-antifung domain-containing protein/Pkinase_Tyr domain-containing protein [Cephalotus follicularis]
MQFPLKFSITLVYLCLLSITTESQPTHLFNICPNSTTYTRNSTFQSNLNILLSSLTSNATLNSYAVTNGFYYSNASSSNPTETAYGLFLCRGDVSASTCQDCVTFAASNITHYCPVRKEATIWYEQCFLRYSNESFFSIADTSPSFVMCNTNNVSEPERFNDLLGATMNDTATRASNAPRRFSAKKANFTAFQTLYSLVQCTPDLSSFDCNRCLLETISYLPQYCGGKQGGRLVGRSCNVRYEMYPFYDETAAAALDPPPPPVSPPPPASPGSVPTEKGKSGVSSVKIIAIVAPVVVSVLLFVMGYCFITRRSKKKSGVVQEETGVHDITTVKSLQFDFKTIEAATNSFSDDNKLGEGGFGEVYKGTLPMGQEIAVKRLSRSSGQGAEEFMNEMVLVAKLQHRNLVRLLGFCLEGEEKILVYEFVPNKSLDYFLFDPEKQGQLNWSTRYKIIGGVARGILYLHEDSRLRIIHRDLKCSNILLDGDMNPKVSDFGMARIFGVDQTQASTNRIVGTYGYMSPEYLMRGQFSLKSDVYSFGVLILEIITGKKNSSFYQTYGATNLLSHAWKHWRDGAPLELLDPILRDSYSRNEVIRCIHIGLLCVQEDPADRPTLATIVLMLNSYSATLPLPQEPAFLSHTRTGSTESSMPTKGLVPDQSTIKSTASSVDDSSITEVYPR